jgi:CheY-like chemotaxis protein/anti-sigma regulatory factor (Ser/Thr protein kinase)
MVLALETMPVGADDPGRKQRLVIERQAQHLARLVDDLLDVARVTSGKVRLQRVPLDLRDVVSRCINAAELAARARSIGLHLETPARALVVEADLVRLEEVFNNLVGNAIKYSPDGSRIDVRLFDDDGWYAVEISDTGVGIAPDMLRRVFDLFEQATPSLDRSQGGLGVGLTLVRALVELHGGTVEAHSDGLGRGSRFTVRLRPSLASAASVQSRAELQPVTSVAIVVVDDNLDLLELMKDLLEATGCTVHVASDGPTGLATIVDVVPDLALIDIGLPGLDGYQIARQLRGLDVPVCLVAMTGYGQPEDRQRAHAAGFDLHLTKPVTTTALQQAIATCQQRRRRSERRS